MATGERIDPFRGFNFRIEIDGITVGSFSEVSGLSSDGDAVEYRNGDDVRLSVRKLMGLRKYANVTLKRGYTANDELWKWRANIVSGQADRRHGAIILMDEERKDVLAWDFEDAWIHKIDGPALNAKGNEVAIETVELVVEFLKLRTA
jgi:phage tail-like protein